VLHNGREAARREGMSAANGSCYPDHSAFRGYFVTHKLGFHTFYMCAKFYDSSLNHSRDITGAPKLKLDHLTLTTPPLMSFVISMLVLGKI